MAYRWRHHVAFEAVESRRTPWNTTQITERCTLTGKYDYNYYYCHTTNFGGLPRSCWYQQKLHVRLHKYHWRQQSIHLLQILTFLDRHKVKTYTIEKHR